MNPSPHASGLQHFGAVACVLLLAAAAAAVATGFLPFDDFRMLIIRISPVLAFVVAITVVAELAGIAGVFTALAERMAAWCRGRLVLLWLLVLVIAVLSTAFLSLDTTAVLVTPVVVVLAVHVGVSPVPFALATVWLANTASLFLPVSNLTNLLAADSFGVHPMAFLGALWAPALVGVAASVAVLTFVFRRSLQGRFDLPVPAPVTDRPLLIYCSIVVLLLLPMLVSGIEVAVVAGVAAVLLLGAFLVRKRAVVGLSLVPWQTLGIVVGLFVLVAAAHAHGLETALAAVAGSGEDLLSLLQLSAAGALGANLINNLPAYLVLEPLAASPLRLGALLIGVNLGPLVTPWASLATLLWYQRLAALGVQLSWPRFMCLGLVAAIVVVPLATLALALT